MLAFRRAVTQPCRHRLWTNTTTTRNLWQSPIRRNSPNPSIRASDAPLKSPFTADEAESFVARTGNPSIRNQVLFFVFGSATIFSYAAWYTNLRTEEVKQRLASGTSRWRGVILSSLDLRRYEQAEIVKHARAGYARILTETAWIPNAIRPTVAIAYATLRQPWVDVSDGKRLCWKIVLLNIGVYAAWKIPRLSTAMWRNFTHSPLSGKSFTLLTAVFSHMSLMHLFFNCFALEGFGSTASIHLMREQERTSDLLESSPAYHTLAFFCSAGIFSSLVSHIVQAKLRYPAIIKSLASSPISGAKPLNWTSAVASETASITQNSSSAFRTALGVGSKVNAKVRETIVPSLGASGAIYACLSMTAMAFPEAKIALMIPPSFPIDIQYGVGALVCLDMVGVLRGWRMFDHFAHLGGAAFGVGYYYYGMPLWNSLRMGFLASDNHS